METPAGAKKAEFNRHMNQFIAAIETSFENNTFKQDGDKFQKHLDKLANKYQQDEQLGKLRHKLYDAQALVYYLDSNDQKAMEFVDAAEELNGGPTVICSQIRSSIQSETSEVQTFKSKPAVKKKKIEGWLAVLILGVILGIAFNTYSFISGLSDEKSITPAIESAYPGIKSLVNVENTVQILAALCGLVLLYFIFKRKRVARYFGIFFFTGIVLFSVGDLSVATNMFANNKDASSFISQQSGTYGRAIFFSVIWAAYLIFSKRAKATLDQ